MKHFVFGIDGATFNIINPLIKKGKLPNLSKLIKQGAYGQLESTTPPHSGPAWVSAATGVGPGSHGIYQFWDTQSADYVGKFMGSNDCQVPTIWDIFNRYGYKTGVVNVPMTHPPKKIDGFMISWPLSKTLRYSYPEDLLREIAKAGGHYLADLFVMFGGDLTYIKKALKITKKRIKTVKFLLEKYPVDFFMIVFPEVDRISHYYWHFFDKKSPEYIDSSKVEMKKALEIIYIAVDQALGEILSYINEDCSITILSDHGFGPGLIDFHVQNFLLENGFLKLKKITREEFLLQKGSWFIFEKRGNFYTVDWARTLAYMAAPGSYGVNINLEGRQKNGIVNQQEYKKVKRKIIKAIEKVKHPQNNERLFKVVENNIYVGAAAKKAPDLILIPYDYGVMVHHNFIKKGMFSRPEQKGMHRENGIFIMKGQNVVPGKIEGARIEDIVPSVLYSSGIKIPKYIEGKILPVFSRSFQVNHPTVKQDWKKIKRKKEHSYSSQEQKEVEKRLQALGYL